MHVPSLLLAVTIRLLLVVVSPVSASSNGDCDFNTASDGFCQWTPGHLRDYFWSRTSGSTGTRGSGPQGDHSKDGRGSYIYTHVYYGKYATTNTTSPSINLTTEGVCFSFWYSMNGEEIGTLNVLSVMDGGAPVLLWTRFGNQGRDWQHGAIHIPRPDGKSAGTVKVVVQATMRGTYHHNDIIGVDDFLFTTGECPARTGYCPFESADGCGYSNDDEATFPWTRRSEDSGESLGPARDHTLGTSQGHYMMANLSRQMEGDTARLISHFVPKSDGVCLKFYFSMPGADTGILNVYTRDHNNDLHGPVWTRTGGALNKWLGAKVTVASESSFQVVFEGVVGNGSSSGNIIAIDDVMISPYPCSKPATCDFEKDSCTFQSESANGDDWVDWSRDTVKGSTLSYGAKDHTLSSQYGHVMYAYASENSKRARLLTEYLPTTNESCLTFYYMIASYKYNGNRVLTVSLDKLSGNSMHLSTLWSITGREQYWTKKQIEVRSTQPYSIAIEVQLEKSDSAGIDDVSLSDGPCEVTPTIECDYNEHINYTQVCDFIVQCDYGNEDEKRCGSCDFTNDLLCGLHDVSRGSFSWKVGTDETATDLEPRVGSDHTHRSLKGSFVYVHWDGGRDATAAILNTPTIQSSYETCVFQFFYKRWSGDFAVYIELDTRTVEVWRSMTINSDNSWIQAQVRIGRFANPFQVSIRSSSLSFSQHSIAIDDTKFINCAKPTPSSSSSSSSSSAKGCSSNQFTCTNKVCIATIHKCDLADDCGDMSDEMDASCGHFHQCTFEDKACNWTQSETNDLDWISHSGATQSDTVPRRDHTTNTDAGTYLYLKSTPSTKPGQVARLLSPVLKPTSQNSRCYLVLYYHMLGKSMGSLNVYTETEEDGYTKRLYKRQHFWQDFWVRDVISLVVNDSNFRVIIEGIVGLSTDDGDMAIDDVTLSAGCTMADGIHFLPTPQYTVTTVATLARCLDSQFRCDDGKCIGGSYRCDSTSECPDGSDEKYCGACGFESGSGMCGWRHVGTGHFKWSLAGTQEIGMVGPSADTNTHTHKGHYVYIKKNTGISSKPAVLRSPPLGPISKKCIVSFDYYIDLTLGKLSLDINTLGVVTHLWSSASISTDFIDVGWTKGLVNLREITGPLPRGSRLEISFVADTKTNISTISPIIASVDNILLSQCTRDDSVPDIDCNFDHDLCNWRQSGIDSGEFKVKTTSASTSGHAGKRTYLDVDHVKLRRGETILLESIPIPSNSRTGFCFSFWYYMDGVNSGTLQLMSQNVQENAHQQLLWSVRRRQLPEWQEMRVYVNQTLDYKLVFKAVTTKHTEYEDNTMALDDFSIVTGECPLSAKCSFENGFCDWTQDDASLIKWTVGKKGSELNLTGPDTDYTLGTEYGHYVFISSRNHHPGQTAVMTSKTLTAVKFAQGGCLTFRYFMYGASVGILHVYKIDDGGRISQLWNVSDNLGAMWRKASVQIETSGETNFQIEIQGTLGVGSGYIAVDDVFVNNDDFCEPAGSCTFEGGLCGFVSIHSYDLHNWALVHGMRGYNTGPKEDHTTGTIQGKYMLSSNSREGYRALLASDTLSPTPNGCLSFWYRMYGKHTGKLSVYSKTSLNQTLVWSLEKEQGNRWLQAKIDFQSGVYFEFIFEAVSGGSYDGDILIDDISFTKDQSCEYVSPTANVSKTTKHSDHKPTSLDCDFESNSCLWKDTYQSSSDGWVRTKASDVIYDHRTPPSDHTLDNALGHYIYAGTDGSKLISPTVTVPENGICFQFWYYMYGESVSEINIDVKRISEYRSEQVWTKSGTQGPEWKYAEIHIQNIRGNVSLIIDVQRDRSSSTPALDDFSMSYGSCPQRNICDFENGFCGYIQATADDFDWLVRYHGAVVPGPKFDHTYGTPNGGYAYVLSSSPRKPGEKARMKTQSHSPTSTSCLSFWYNMNGKTMGTLNIWIEKDGPGMGDNPIWTKSENQGSDWHKAYATISSSLEFKIVFEAVIGSGIFSNMAVDDIQLTPGFCPELGFCDFEKDECSWRNVDNNELNWVREYAYSGSVCQFADHTLNTDFGRFLCFHNRRYGYNAKYISPPLDRQKLLCLNFWYTLYESTLYVSSQELVSEVEGGILFKTTNYTSKWTPLRMTVGPFPKEFNIVVVGVPSKGHVAIDDLSIQEGSCESLPPPSATKNVFQCPGGRFLSRRELCDFQRDCQEGEDEQPCGYNCNFENGTCKWEASTHGSEKWSLRQGTDEKGPSIDKTLSTENGHYYHIEKRTDSSGYVGYSPTLKSPLLQRSSPTCELEVSMIFYKVSSGGVFYIVKHSGSEQVTLFENKDKEFGPAWQTLTIPLGESEVPFRVSIQAKAGRTKGSDIAVDDIYFKHCQYPEPESSCTSLNTFKCKNRACIHPSLVCNFKDDCGDGSDELMNETCSSYSRCSFENDMCDWSQERYDDDFDWTRSNVGSFRNHNSGPAADHSTSLQSGYFMSTSGRKSTSIHGNKAWLLSPVLGPVSRCSFNFYLLMHGKHIETFTVYTRSETGGELNRVFTTSGEAGTFWRHVSIDIKSTRNFQIVLEGIRGKTGYEDEIDIDDVTLSPECGTTSSESLPRATAPPTLTPTSPCGIYKWQCADKKQCIYKSQLCDFVTQCEDKSDENHCGACDFETSWCGWKDRSKGRNVWDRANATSMSRDASTGSFLQVVSKGFGYFRPAVLVSPLYGSTEEGCSMSFNGKHITTDLRLELVPKNAISYEYSTQNNTILWNTRYVYSRRTWSETTVSIGARSSGFYLVFRSMFESSKNIIAIDEITFSKSCGTVKSSACLPGEFVCTESKECKPFSSRCDLAKDCRGGEDEQDCDKYYSCDFERGTCGFVQDPKNDFDWILDHPSTSSVVGPIERDHTLGTQKGHLMYIAKMSPNSEIQGVARFKGPVMYGNEHGSCYMRMFYHLNGNYTNAINVYTETKEGGDLNQKLSISKEEEEEGDEWKKVVIQLIETRTFRVVIEAVRDTGYMGDIGIDDISFTPHCIIATRVTLQPLLPTPDPGSFCKKGIEFPCGDGKTCLPVEKRCDFHADCKDGSDESSCPSQCNFEHGMCGWQSSMSSGAQIVPVEASGSTTNKDHNPGTEQGHFLTPTTRRLRSSSKIMLTSPLFRSSSHTCSFSFWYIRLKNDPPLVVSLRTSGFEDVLWKKGNYENVMSWDYQRVALPPCLSDFQIVVSYEYNEQKSTLTYLDDFAFSGCYLNTSAQVCKDEEFQCANGLCISKDKVCDLGNDCCDGSDEDAAKCYRHRKSMFESGMDGWKKGIGSTGWLRSRGNIRQFYNGAVFDHTTHSSHGYYLHQKCPKSYTVFGTVTYEMPSPYEECVVTFWYQYSGKDVGMINVGVRTRGKERLIIASMNSNATNIWKRGEVRIDLRDEYELIFEGSCFSSLDSGNNIDDIVFSPSCNVKPLRPPPPTEFAPSSTNTTTTTSPTTFKPCASTSSDQFQCLSNGDCIPKSKVCDFSNDCSDESDETICHTDGTCEFDGDLCTWSEEVLDFLDWKSSKSSDVPGNQGPSSGPNGRTDNSYAYVRDSIIQNIDLRDRIASLKSRTFSSAAAGCTIEFYYYLDGSNPGTLSLEIGTPTSNTSTTLWEARETSSSWVRAVVGIGRRMLPFVLTFTKSSSPTYSGQVAIDGIQFPSKCTQLPYTRHCDGGTYRCKRGACIPEFNICDGQDDCGDGSDENDELCKDYIKENFDSNPPMGRLSGQGSKRDLTWSVWNSSSSSPPPKGLSGVDHSTGLAAVGRYLYADPNPSTVDGDYLSLLSPAFMAVGFKACEIRFYAMVPTKDVSVEVGYQKYSSIPPTTYNGVEMVPGTYWQLVAFTFYAIPQPFRLIIKASLGGPHAGAIGIDDVTFGKHCVLTNYSLPSVRTTPPPGCPSNQFQCAASGHCVPSNKVCDDVMDCPDHSDEKACSCGSYCQNGGKCSISSDGLRSCQCFNGHFGKRCEGTPPTTTTTTTPTTPTTTSTTTTPATTTTTTTATTTKPITTTTTTTTTTPSKPTVSTSSSSTPITTTTATRATPPATTTATTSDNGQTHSTTPSLTNGRPGHQNGGGSQSQEWKTPVGVVLGLVAALALLTVAIYVYRKHRVGRYRTPVIGGDGDEGYTNPIYIHGNQLESDLKEDAPHGFVDSSVDYTQPGDTAFAIKSQNHQGDRA